MRRILYLDESGTCVPHHEPLLDGETPLFVLTGLILDPSRWRAYDRQYLALKRQFFKKEIERSGRRAEAKEIKGTKLLGPHNADNRRNGAFVDHVLKLCAQYDAKLISYVKKKTVGHHGNPVALYATAMHAIAERYHSLLAEASTHGAIIADSQMQKHNQQMIESHLSYVFGHEDGRQLDRIVEAPLFADSKVTTGLQIVDILSYIIFGYHLRSLEGFSRASHYAHLERYWEHVQAMEFRQRHGRVHGFRVDLSERSASRTGS